MPTSPATLPVTSPLTSPATVRPTSDLDEIACHAAALARNASAANTQRGYAADWRHFDAWCRDQGVTALPASPVTVGSYIAAHSGTYSVATLERRLAALARTHRLAGYQLDTKHPAIREVLRGIRRERGTRPRKVAAAVTATVKAMASTCDDSLSGRRDRALLLIGFAGAFRRSELTALTMDDVTATAEGLRVVIRRSKTDADGAGQIIGIARTGTATCPVVALERWLSAAEITNGPLFRRIDRHGKIRSGLSDQAVALIVKRRAALAGWNPAEFSGHSLRAGLATSAAAAGVEERDIARQTRHRSMSVLRGYIREGDLFRRNASAAVGL